MMYPTNPTGYFNIPEPSFEPPEERQISRYCAVCGCPLDLYDPWPLCGVCADPKEDENG